jgi:hypothetical protein
MCFWRVCVKANEGMKDERIQGRERETGNSMGLECAENSHALQGRRRKVTALCQTQTEG